MTESFRPPHGPCYADLRGQTALVTGGGAGIGRGICLRLAVEGMHVFFCGRTEATLQETARMMTAAGGRGTPIVADISQVDSISNLFAAMKRESGCRSDQLQFRLVRAKISGCALNLIPALA